MRDVFVNLMDQTGKSIDNPDDLAEINERIERLRREGFDRIANAFMEALREEIPRQHGDMKRVGKAMQDNFKASQPFERVLMGLTADYADLGFTGPQVQKAFTEAFASRELDYIEIFPWIVPFMRLEFGEEPDLSR